jgi:N-methylhydantoinase B
MTSTMERTGRSSVYAIARDYSNAIFDWASRIILQGEDLPTHLGSLILATKAVTTYFDGDIEPGDVLFHNDPMWDGSHIVDWCMYKPVFYDDELLFWVVSKGHVIDAGGPVPGSYNSAAREIYAEGLRIPPIKIVSRGVPREDVINLILTNVRSRRNQKGDMNAQFGAVGVAERQLSALAEKFGLSVVRSAVEALLDQAERHMRNRIAELPDGVYTSEVIAEDAGHGRGDQRIGATVTVRNDELDIVLNAPPQLEFYTNSYRSNTLSGVYAGLMMFTQIRPPFNEGLYRPIHVDFGPEGTMINAREPAPHVNCTGGPQETVCDVVRKALTSAAPAGATASWNHTWGINIAGVDPESGEPYVDLVMSTVVGGAGAVDGLSDGWHAVGAQAALGAIQTGDSELVERLAPIIVRRLSLAEDTGGAGRWRGGCGLITEIEPIDHVMTVITWGEGFKYPVMGVGGAHSRLPERKVAKGWHMRGSESLREVGKNVVFTVKPGETYVTRSAGGGGAGNPLDRSPAMVLADVLGGKVSVEAAELEYGVLVDTATSEICHEKTEALRKAMRIDGSTAK